MNLGQVNFSKGVLSEDLHGRVDVQSYRAGLKRGENIIVLKHGGFRNRQGTHLVAELDGPGKLFPFRFSIDQPYALAFTQGRMQPFAFGGSVLEEELRITAITNANPALVTIPYHGYSTGDLFYARNVEGMTEINDRILRITVLNNDQFLVPVDSTDWGAFTGSGGGTLRVAPPAPDPTPPVVPPVVPPPDPPQVGGGGGPPVYNCVTDDTPILLADGREIPAARLKVGDRLRTRHERSLEWGEYPVTAIEFAREPVLSSDRVPVRATAKHRFFLDGAWVEMASIGRAAGAARVAKISVAGAQTYVSNGVLSHNIKLPDYDPGIY